MLDKTPFSKYANKVSFHQYIYTLSKINPVLAILQF